ncbi:hypothetical protein K435DRAFT_476803 [Dendrothele bispora CBS 962.96]|uniref:Uncharacterized protein n=1 Tax=Dendrothele bispora (strain CBS 962.96) TaxID=1314807 RepID=A0A4S8MBH4_DENBC|nr:hypothetical protein K435DRAFT_476803 [Dendrothele bispora CBS 962.96]
MRFNNENNDTEPRLALVRTPTNDSRRNGHHHHHHHHHSDEFGRLTSKSSSSRHPAAVDVNASRPAVHRRGRLPAVQNYEVVNNHVVEDGPERTVTISTWREQVANEARRSEVEMSIYYVNADEYAVEGLDEAALASYNRLTGRKETGTTANNDSKRKDRKKDRLTAARVEELRKLGMTDALEGDRRVGRAGFEPNVPGLSRGHNGIVDRAQTPWPSFSETGEYEGEDDFSNLHHVRGRGVDVGIRKKSSSALMKIPKHQNGNGSGSRNGDFRPDMSPERTSTPIHISRSPPRSAWIPGRPSRERALSPLYRSGSPPNANGSVRNGNGNGNGALGPTNSSEDSDRVEIPLALTQVLGTCEPPLLHISRALVELGITTEDHLRAVGKLKNSTRDREVKEEALKRGITIMEWAILLDRLQSL